jgi:integrase
MPAKSNLRLVAPSNQNRTVLPSRATNAAYRKREHLTPAEIDKLIEAAKHNRYGHRDATLILVAFRHGLRASELCELEWNQIDWNAATLHVRRAKNGKPYRARPDQVSIVLALGESASKRLIAGPSGRPRPAKPRQLDSSCPKLLSCVGSGRLRLFRSGNYKLKAA